MSETKKELSFSLKYLYGVGDAGFVLMSNIETFYFMTFLTNAAGFSAAMAGVINSVFSIIDACLSWVYGGIINGTKAKKWGRYRSWLILLPWIVPFIFAFQFIRVSENELVSAVVIVVAAVVSHFIWNFPYVANATLVAVVGKTPDDKATLASSRATWNNIGGILFSYLGLPFATFLGTQISGAENFGKYGYAAAAFVLGIVMVITYWAHFKMTDGYEELETEGAPVANKNKINIGEMFASLFKNPQLIILMLADLAKWCVKFVTAASAIYYFRDAAGNPGLMTAYSLAIGISAAVGAYVARYVCSKISARTSMIIALLAMGVFLLVAFFGYANPTMVIIFICCAQIFYGVAFAAAPALYADTVVYTTWKTGKNAAGWIMGLQNLPLKIGVFLRGTIVSACLVAADYDNVKASGVTYVGTAIYDGAARQSMTYALCLVPAIFCFVGAILILLGFKITKEKVAQCQAEIDAKG